MEIKFCKCNSLSKTDDIIRNRERKIIGCNIAITCAFVLFRARQARKACRDDKAGNECSFGEEPASQPARTVEVYTLKIFVNGKKIIYNF